MYEMQESYSPKERAKLVREGYADDVEKQPSVVPLTTMAASMAVNQLLGLMGVFGVDHTTRKQAEIKGGFTLSDSPDTDDGCVCVARRGIPFQEHAAQEPGGSTGRCIHLLGNAGLPTSTDPPVTKSHQPRSVPR